MRTVQKLPDVLKVLLALVRAGKLLAVQQWISEDRNYGAAEIHRLNPVYEAMGMRFSQHGRGVLAGWVKSAN